MAVAAFSR